LIPGSLEIDYKKNGLVRLNGGTDGNNNPRASLQQRFIQNIVSGAGKRPAITPQGLPTDLKSGN
jgi:hypothetical protein